MRRPSGRRRPCSIRSSWPPRQRVRSCSYRLPRPFHRNERRSPWSMPAPPCDDDGVVSKLLGACALALSLAACSGDSGREFARYYDPEGFFVTNLPAAHDLTVTPPRSDGDGPGLLTGVVASPPQPSPSAPSTTAFDLAPAEPQDRSEERRVG